MFTTGQPFGISVVRSTPRDLKKKCWLELVNTFNRKENATEADLNELGK